MAMIVAAMETSTCWPRPVTLALTQGGERGDHALQPGVAVGVDSASVWGAPRFSPKWRSEWWVNPASACTVGAYAMRPRNGPCCPYPEIEM